MNHLYYGPDLTVMQRMPKHAMDLIYLDLVSDSKQSYRALYRNMTGRPVPEQAKAFSDAWTLDAEEEELARMLPALMRESGVEGYYVELWRSWMNALRRTQPHLLARVNHLTPRLLQLKSILRPSGSIYLHCDPTTSHCMKIMMDGIFGHHNFRNELIWKRAYLPSRFRRWHPVHDVILFYSASDKYTWNSGGEDVLGDARQISPHAYKGSRHVAQERIALRERIIRASTRKGDLVFDPFCGSGTTLCAAEQTGRKWIGSDTAMLSIALTRQRLTEQYGVVEGKDFDVEGIPASVEQAQVLFKESPTQFEHWIVEHVGGYPTSKTDDAAVSGRLYLHTHQGPKAMVLSAKGGKIRPTDVRNLRRILDTESDCELAGFLSLQEPTRAMKEKAARFGQYEYQGMKYDRVQLLTVQDVLERKQQFQMPS